jgi:hypothetical protein
LKKPFIRICSGRFNGNGTFLQIPESIIPGCRQFTVTPAVKEQTVNISRFTVILFIVTQC